MRHIDLPLQIDLLRELGADFTALHTKVTTLDPEPGGDLLGRSVHRSSLFTIL
ncbi:hypothetical protein [Streptomyces sp. IBSNAI001]|uniref:hypothetical protein n=1 Tax=Streptomyces sp. IBSNAI001 TaxID=3457499 RepID=UPI003FD38B35